MASTFSVDGVLACGAEKSAVLETRREQTSSLRPNLSRNLPDRLVGWQIFWVNNIQRACRKFGGSRDRVVGKVGGESVDVSSAKIKSIGSPPPPEQSET